MKRAAWLARKGHACETIALGSGKFPFYSIIHDGEGRQAEGFGSTEERAFSDAHARYLAARRRADHSKAADRLERLRNMQPELGS